MTTLAILLAGGAGTRTRRSENKVYLPVGDRPLLAWSLAALQRSPAVDEILLVVRAVDVASAQAVLGRFPAPKLRGVVEGGATRHRSEEAALQAVADDIESGGVDLVLIHDAARPFLSQTLIDRVVDAGRRVGGAVPALPLTGHVVREADPGRVTTVEAEAIRRVQTPQAFWARPLLAAYRAAARAGLEGVDTAESVTRFGDVPIEAVDGDPRNIKVTFVEDLFAAEELTAQFRSERD